MLCVDTTMTDDDVDVDFVDDDVDGRNQVDCHCFFFVCCLDLN